MARTIPRRLIYVDFDIQNGATAENVVSTAKTIKADAILSSKKFMNRAGITNVTIEQLKAQGIPFILLWQPTDDNNANIQYNMDDMTVQNAKINELISILNEFPSLDGLHLEEPTIHLNTPPELWLPVPDNGCGCFKRNEDGTCPRPPHTRKFEILAPVFTAFFNRIRTTVLRNDQSFSFNSPSLNPFGGARWCGGLDIPTLDSMKIFDWIALQTGGAMTNYEIDSTITTWENVVSNTAITAAVYGWDAGGGGTTSRTACVNRPGDPLDKNRPWVKECFNNNILDSLYNLSVTNPHGAHVTQIIWNIPPEWINNSYLYPCTSGSWNLACAIGGIPLPPTCPKPQFTFNINQV